MDRYRVEIEGILRKLDDCKHVKDLKIVLRKDYREADWKGVFKALRMIQCPGNVVVEYNNRFRRDKDFDGFVGSFEW